VEPVKPFKSILNLKNDEISVESLKRKVSGMALYHDSGWHGQRRLPSTMTSDIDLGLRSK
jgi:hypothetical protein